MHRSLRSFLLISLVSAQSASAAGLLDEAACGRFFRVLAPVVESANTTTLRQEKKWVVPSSELDRFLKELERRHGGVPLRDIPKPGTANVTVTDYTRDIELPATLEGKRRKAKIRIRRYGSRPLDGGEDEVTIGEQYQTRSKLEFKIRHPDYDGVVFKPGIVMENSDIDLLFKSKESFYKNIAEVKKRTKALTKLDPSKGGYKRVNKDDKEVDEMLDAIRGIHEDMTKPSALGEFPQGLSRVHQVQYERDAYELALVDKTDPANPKTVKVQITADRNVKFRQPGDPQVKAEYPKDWRVIEVKVPLEYSQMSDAELEKRLPELLAIRRLTGSLKQVEEMPGGTGKAAGSRIVRADGVRERGLALDADALEEAFADAGRAATGTVAGAKQELKALLRDKPVSDYFQQNGREIRRVANATVQRNVPLESSIAALRDDINTLADLNFNELSRMFEQRTLSVEGEAYFELLKEFKAFNRKYRNGWLTEVLNEKYSTLNALKPGSVTLNDVYRMVLDDFVEAQGAVANQTTLAEKWAKFRKGLEPRARSRKVQQFLDFAKERGTKTIVGRMVAFPVTGATTVGTWFSYAWVCTHYGWKCPFVTKGPNVERAERSRKYWADNRPQVVQAEAELARLITTSNEAIAKADDPMKTWTAMTARSNEIGLALRRVTNGVLVSEPQIADQFRLKHLEITSQFQASQRNLAYARSSGDVAAIKKAREGYTQSLAALIAAETYLPSLRNESKLADTPDNVRESDVGLLNQKYLESLRRIDEELKLFMHERDGA